MLEGIKTFSFPTTIIFGKGAIGQLPECLKEEGITNPLIVTDRGLRKTKIINIVEGLLRDRKIPCAVFDQVNPNPLTQDVEEAAQAYLAGDCDGVIGLGGGSPIDAAKVVSVLVANDGPLTLYDCQTGGNTNIVPPLPPVIAIPTTAGTGSEVGRCSVITSKELGRKFMVCSPHMMPKRAILDPELTVGLPPELTAATGMDAFTHNIEALAVQDFHPMCDAIALKGIEFVAKYLERAVQNPADMKARGHMMMAATMGAVAFQKDLGAAHSLAHPLSTECDVQHGLANAICLPHVMRFNREVSAAEYAKVAQCFDVETTRITDLQAADKAIDAVVGLNDKIGIPRTLAQVGVKEEQLPGISKKAFFDCCHQTNPRPCTEEDLLMLLKKAFFGE
ncbi:MAG: iron-containing alcohol dehydrogenase [Proteobacteria bacterium]|nr:iron-containing alcohol dehydrogenase [Pseudomonadota bacterium]